MTVWSPHTEPRTWPQGVIAYSSHGSTAHIPAGEWTYLMVPDDEESGISAGQVSIGSGGSLSTIASEMAAREREDLLLDLALAPQGSAGAAALLDYMRLML